MTDDHVIIIGAGPTGLTAAVFLVQAGVKVTILESRTKIYDDPRAATFHPPTMEMFAKSGITKRLHDMGIRHVVALQNFGLMSQDRVESAMWLLTQEVMPLVAARIAGRSPAGG